MIVDGVSDERCFAAGASFSYNNRHTDCVCVFVCSLLSPKRGEWACDWRSSLTGELLAVLSN